MEAAVGTTCILGGILAWLCCLKCHDPYPRRVTDCATPARLSHSLRTPWLDNVRRFATVKAVGPAIRVAIVDA